VCAPNDSGLLVVVAVMPCPYILVSASSEEEQHPRLLATGAPWKLAGLALLGVGVYNICMDIIARGLQAGSWSSAGVAPRQSLRVAPTEALSLAAAASTFPAKGQGAGVQKTAAVPPEGVLEWLRGQAFNKATEKALLEHPIVAAAEAGTMSMEAVKLVLLEEYSIEKSDLRSMAAALARFGGDTSRAFFLSSVDGEAVGLKELVAMAKVLGMSDADLAAYQPMPQAHAYSAYLAQLSNYGGAAAIAAGFAVNFPTWGRMCGRIRDALLKAPYSMSKDDVAFFAYFADPVPGFDESATAVIKEGMANGETIESIRSSIELLQGYEVMFWDAVWAKAKAGLKGVANAGAETTS